MGIYNSDGFYVFSPVTANDRAGILYVAAILGLLFSILTLAVRFHIQRRTFAADFWFVLAATVFGTAQFVTIFIGLSRYDLGKAAHLMSKSNALHAGETAIASTCLFIISNALSKYSVIYFMKRLFSSDNRTARLLCNGFLIGVAVWALGSIITLTAGCDARTKFLGEARCSGQLIRWSIVAAFDAIFEIAIVVLSIVLVVPLQMTTEIKSSIVFAFSFRIAIAIFAIIHVYYISKFTSLENDSDIASVCSLLWQQIEICYCLLAATIPTLRSFIRGYEKAMGWDYSSKYTNRVTTNNSRTATALQLSNLQKSRYEEEPDVEPIDTFNGYPQNYRTKIYGPDFLGGDCGPKRARSNGSGGSRDPIIRKDVEIEISSEEVVPASPNSNK